MKERKLQRIKSQRIKILTAVEMQYTTKGQNSILVGQDNFISRQLKMLQRVAFNVQEDDEGEVIMFLHCLVER